MSWLQLELRLQQLEGVHLVMQALSGVGCNRNPLYLAFLNRRGSNSGARVSVFQFDKDWNVVGGKNLIDTAKIVLAHTEIQKVVPTSIQRRVKPLASTASALAT